jgi:hypothetical protein
VPWPLLCCHVVQLAVTTRCLLHLSLAVLALDHLQPGGGCITCTHVLLEVAASPVPMYCCVRCNGWFRGRRCLTPSHAQVFLLFQELPGQGYVYGARAAGTLPGSYSGSLHVPSVMHCTPALGASLVLGKAEGPELSPLSCLEEAGTCLRCDAATVLKLLAAPALIRVDVPWACGRCSHSVGWHASGCSATNKVGCSIPLVVHVPQSVAYSICCMPSACPSTSLVYMSVGC